MRLDLHEDLIWRTLVVRLVWLVHSLSECLLGSMAGPKYKLKLMKHQGLKGNIVRIKLRESMGKW